MEMTDMRWYSAVCHRNIRNRNRKKGTDAYLHLCPKIQSSVWIKRCLFGEFLFGILFFICFTVLTVDIVDNTFDNHLF